jgi:hypothetical protein
MPQQLPDPTGWLADLMKAQHNVLWPAGDIFDTSEALEFSPVEEAPGSYVKEKAP